MQYLFSVIHDSTGSPPRARWPPSTSSTTGSAPMAIGSSPAASGSPDTATVIDNRGEEAVFTDGPFLESKEYLAGFWIIEAPDLDVALKLAAEGSKPATARSRYGRSWRVSADRRPGGDHPGPPRGVGAGGRRPGQTVRRPRHRRGVRRPRRSPIAVRRWPADGVPPNPGAWLTTTANRKAIDRIRRENKRDDKHMEAQMLHETRPTRAADAGAIDDERLRLIFTCCHPALSMETRIALTLRWSVV